MFSSLSKKIRDIKLLQSTIFFDRKYYCSKYNIKDISIYPYLHYLLWGCELGYNPSKIFNTLNYYKKNIDVKHSNTNALIHYIRFGLLENRIIAPLQYLIDDLIFNIDIPRDFIDNSLQNIIISGWAVLKNNDIIDKITISNDNNDYTVYMKYGTPRIDAYLATKTLNPMCGFNIELESEELKNYQQIENELISLQFRITTISGKEYNFNHNIQIIPTK